MKKIFLFLAAAVLAVSCSDDDSNETGTDINDNTIDLTKLNGKWYYSSFVENGETRAHLDMPCGKDYMEFQSGVYTLYMVTDCIGNTAEGYTDTFDYTLDGNTVMFGPSEYGVITRLTATDLQITQYFDTDEDGDNDPFIINLKK